MHNLSNSNFTLCQLQPQISHFTDGKIQNNTFMYFANALCVCAMML